MASITFNPGVNSVNPTVTMTVTQASQSIANNTSTVNYSLVINRPSAISSSAAKSYSIVINGTTVKSGTTTIGGSGSKTIASGSTTITHNTDGTKSISFSFSLQYNITWAGVYLGTASKSGSMTLSTIPRVSTISCSPTSVALGSSITVSINRSSSSFTHTIQHDFYVGSWTTVATKTTSTSVSFTTDLSWASRGSMKNQTSGGGRIRCITYNGNTQIGEKIINFTCTVPSSVVPTISSISVSDAAGLATTYGGYVQNKSRPKVTISAAGAQGSTISSYSTKVGSVTQSGSSFTAPAITTTGTITITTTVKDSRGRSASKSTSITGLAYATPSIATFTATRVNSSGTSSSSGTYIKVTATGAISSLNSKNKKTYTIYYKASTASSYTTLTSGTANSYSISIDTGALGSGGFATTTSYDIKLTITDNFTSVSRTTTVSTSSILMNYRSSGKGLAIGKASEKDAFEVALPAEFTSTASFSGTTTIGGKNVGTYLSQVDTNKTNISSLTSRVSAIETDLKPVGFLNNSNYSSIITVGNLRGGSITNISGVKYGRVVMLYCQINNITSGGTDATMFTFKSKEYWPIAYGVTNAFINKQDNVCYIGYFSSSGNISWSIAGSGTINSSSKAMVLFTLTYITLQ